jgi:hypothetical protein
MVGRSKSGCGLYLALSFKDLHHPCWGGGRAGARLRVGWRPASSSGIWGVETILQLCGGGVLQPCGGKANCCCPARVQHSVLCPGDCGRSYRRVPQHVVLREGGTRVLGRSCSRFRGKNGGEDLPVRFGVVGARWCSVGGQVDTTVGAEVVAAGESFSTDETVNATRGPTSGSLALISGSRPPRGDTNESLPAVASGLGPLLLL